MPVSHYVGKIQSVYLFIRFKLKDQNISYQVKNFLMHKKLYLDDAGTISVGTGHLQSV